MDDPLSLAVGPIVQETIGTALKLIKKEVALLLGVNSQVEKLSSHLTSINAVLEEAEERQLKEPPLKNWLGKLRNAAYDVQDLLETFATDVALYKRKPQLHKLKTKYNAAHKIKEILSRLDVIAEEKKEFKLNISVNNGQSQIQNKGQPVSDTGSFIDTADVFGREDEKESILKMLLSDEFDKEDDICVIPVIGMAGLGKTTLAQLLFNNERVKQHFESRMWVTVTVDFDLARILKGMIEFHSKMVHDTLSVSLLEIRLLEFLSGLPFLLVLDDVWTEDYQNCWEPLHRLLKQGNKRSRVLVTSRNVRVSQMMGVRSPYRLECLSEHQCWSILEKIAFNHHNLSRGVQQNLENIGREIVGKCQGLPLAVKAMAGFLRKYEDVDKWRKVLNSDIWEIEEGSSNGPYILPSLKLSYDYLPTYLKHCFSICSIFPKSYIFDKAELVKFWIAESLIPSRGQEREEEIGMEIFDELLARSFFQHSNVDDKVRYLMHDLFHDLALHNSSPYVCQVKDEKSCSSSAETRHVLLLCNDVERAALGVVENSEKLRTLLFVRNEVKKIGKEKSSAAGWLRKEEMRIGENVSADAKAGRNVSDDATKEEN